MKRERILYCLNPVDPTGHRFQIQLTIAQPDPKGQELALPAWIPGSYLIRDFSRQLDTLQARCKGKAIAVRKTGNHTWRCAPCRGPLAIDYTVYAWDLSVRGAYFDESHAFFNGTSVFLGVIGQTNEPCHVKLVPPTQARGWKVYTSLPIASGHPDAAKQYGFGVYAAPDYDALIDHPVEMGTPQVLRFKAHGAAHEMVFTGVAPKLDMARIARDVQKICAAQIALFDPVGKQAPFLDSASRYVFMVMVTGDGYGGLEHRASTALMTSRYDLPSLGVEPTEGYQTFLGLVSHEYFHTWNVKRIKPAAFAPYNLSRENHTRLLWVFEGFTSYYDDLMLLRSGVIGENDYLRLLGKTISAVHRGAGRHKQSVAESSFDAWTRYYKQDENSPNVLVSYYTKGSLIALGLDIVIRQGSQGACSLDDVMRLLWERFGRDFYRGAGTGIGENSITRLIREATRVDVGEFIERYVEGCEDVPLDRLLPQWHPQGAPLQKRAGKSGLLPQRGIAITWKPASSDPTLDIRTRAIQGETQIANVFEGGAAHAAGLSAGDTIVAIDSLRVAEPGNLDKLLHRYKAGDVVLVHVFRRDELRAFPVTLAAQAESECTLAAI